MFRYENKHIYPVSLLKDKLENNMVLFLTMNESNVDDILIEDFNRSIYNKVEYKNKIDLAMI